MKKTLIFLNMLLFIICIILITKMQRQPKHIYIRDTIEIRDTVKVNLYLTKENLKQELQDLDVQHHEIVLAQAIHESGHFKSRLTIENNNFLGIKRGNNYAKYDTWRDCIFDYKNRIQNKYKGGDYFEFLQRIKYASDEKYLHHIKKIYKQIKNQKQ